MASLSTESTEHEPWESKSAFIFSATPICSSGVAFRLTVNACRYKFEQYPRCGRLRRNFDYSNILKVTTQSLIQYVQFSQSVPT